MSCSLRVPRYIREAVQLPHTLNLDCVDARHPERPALEAFVADCFRSKHGATPSQFCEQLMGWRGEHGGWQGAVGYTPLHGRVAFLEHYLARPVEQLIAARLGRPVSRDAVVEAGNLAALDAGGTRMLIAGLTRHLHSLGYTWVVLTGTRALLNSFARLGIPMEVLAPADPACLPDRGRGWGSYYETHPQVAFTDIAHAARQLAR